MKIHCPFCDAPLNGLAYCPSCGIEIEENDEEYDKEETTGN